MLAPLKPALELSLPGIFRLIEGQKPQIVLVMDVNIRANSILKSGAEQI